MTLEGHGLGGGLLWGTAPHGCTWILTDREWMCPGTDSQDRVQMPCGPAARGQHWGPSTRGSSCQEQPLLTGKKGQAWTPRDYRLRREPETLLLKGQRHNEHNEYMHTISHRQSLCPVSSHAGPLSCCSSPCLLWLVLHSAAGVQGGGAGVRGRGTGVGGRMKCRGGILG